MSETTGTTGPTATGGTAGTTGAGPAGPVQPARPAKVKEKRYPGIWIRLFIYVAVGHVFAAFLYLLFEVGAK
ncbi:DUF6126 family protein [Streptomyces sp. NPDC093252]|uniref:DUF6126 family protein n=1 Tax=Streptomyces sp. NPDC093252 TaxID=3154980 RepID=UPI0034131CFF